MSLRVFENKVLRGLCELKRDQVTGGWIKLRNEELHNLCSAPNTIRIINSGRMRDTARGTRVRESNSYRILVGK
jgi:hypothetical protein